MQRALRVIGGRFRARKLDRIDAVKIANLIALRLQPDVFDSRNLRGHRLDARHRLVLVILRRSVLPLVDHHVDHALRLPKPVLRRNALRVPIPGGNTNREKSKPACNFGETLSREFHSFSSSISHADSLCTAGKRSNAPQKIKGPVNVRSPGLDRNAVYLRALQDPLASRRSTESKPIPAPWFPRSSRWPVWKRRC